MPKIEFKKNSKTPIKLRKKCYNNITEKLNGKICKKYLENFNNQENYNFNCSNIIINHKNKKHNLKVRNFKEIKSKMLNNSLDFKRIKTNNNNKSNKKLNLKNNNHKNKIEVLNEFEKKSLLIQKIFRGRFTRKKYERKLSNIKNNNNNNLSHNNNNNKIEVLKDFEKKSLLIQKMLRGRLTRKKYERKLTNIKNKRNISKDKKINNYDNKIGVLQEFEKKSLLIQKMLRGRFTRKKYERKLTNIKNKRNISKDKKINNYDNKIGVLQEFEKNSLLIQKMLRGRFTRKKYEKKLTNIKNNMINQNSNINNNKVLNSNISKNNNNKKNSTYKEIIDKYKIGILKDLERKTLIIQKMFRGKLLRKRLEKKLENVRNEKDKKNIKNNMNDNKKNIIKNKSQKNSTYHELIDKYKIGILKDLEKKSLIIQKMFRGRIIRKRYEKKLINIKNKKNINKSNVKNKNKIEVFKEFEKKSLLIQRMFRGSSTRKKYEKKIVNMKNNKDNKRNKSKKKELNKSKNSKKIKKNESISSLRSEISKMSLNSEDLDFSEDTIKDSDLPSDVD